MEIIGILRQAYKECERLDSIRRQKDAVLEDCAGLHAIDYASPPVSGGRDTDLTDTLLNIERKQKKLEKLYVLSLDKLLEHRNEAYKRLQLIPDSLYSTGKSAVEEHYLFHKSWAEVAVHLHYSRDHVKHLAKECIRKIEELPEDLEG